ncbi:MAG: hypothetical protein QME52_04955 [Bacteroidota bacterium]|nr:hypothetical protein [Bacteroidota bacterium]
MAIPIWLPELFPVEPWTNNTYDLLYEVFKKDFVESRPILFGKEIWYFPEIENGKLKIFWHLTSREDQTTRERLPDFRRSERLPWARPIIEHYTDHEILIWNYEEGDGDIHTYIWLRNYDYLLILKKYKDGGCRIITSYWIEYEDYKNKLQKKYGKRVLNGL